MTFRATFTSCFMLLTLPLLAAEADAPAAVTPSAGATAAAPAPVVRGASDAEIAAYMVGKWAKTMFVSDIQVKVSIVYRRDGTFTATGRATKDFKSFAVNMSGTWRVSDGGWLTTVVNAADFIKIKGPISEKERIVSVSDKTLSVRTTNGSVLTMTRVVAK